MNKNSLSNKLYEQYLSDVNITKFKADRYEYCVKCHNYHKNSYMWYVSDIKVGHICTECASTKSEALKIAAKKKLILSKFTFLIGASMWSTAEKLEYIDMDSKYTKQELDNTDCMLRCVVALLLSIVIITSSILVMVSYHYSMDNMSFRLILHHTQEHFLLY